MKRIGQAPPAVRRRDAGPERGAFRGTDRRAGGGVGAVPHAPRFPILYGSLRARSFSRFFAYEAARLLEATGGEIRIYDAHGLPLPDDTTADQSKVQELHALPHRSKGQVWVSPERRGSTGVITSKVDWLPLSEGSVRPTPARTLAVMQASGGSQSFAARPPRLSAAHVRDNGKV